MIVQADALHIPLAPGSVHCVVTSPPYWALRDYGTAQWIGGDPECSHDVRRWEGEKQTQGAQSGHASRSDRLARNECACGAVRVDNQLGLEPVHDCLAWARGEPPCGTCYVCAMRRVFAELWRVLRDDGTCWLNLGDSFSGSAAHGSFRHGAGRADGIVDQRGQRNRNGNSCAPGLKPKDLCMIPARVALALQADGWYLRSDIIWAKKSPMPESVTDRPTKSHEYIFLLAKSQRYFYDAEAVKETNSEYTINRAGLGTQRGTGTKGIDESRNDAETLRAGSITANGRNRRTVWHLASAPYSGAHYATYPPALVEPCILAGTSARGVCPVCGAPWVRVVDGQRLLPAAPSGNREIRRWDSEPEGQLGGRRVLHTTGWRPSCTCAAADAVPAVVLDPFAGSGTTGMVARHHARRFVGLDISLEYLRNHALVRAENTNTAESMAALPLFANIP